MAFFYSLFSLVRPLVQENEQVEETMAHSEFIERLAPYAQELQKDYGILPSIILGQAILESDWGHSQLASEYNNLFGIKAYEGQEKITLETKEFVNEEWVTIQGDFRVYSSWEESMNDHTQLFINGVSWNPAKYSSVLTAQNYQEAAKALQDAGYATDPDYSEKIISVIKSNNLDQYD